MLDSRPVLAYDPPVRRRRRRKKSDVAFLVVAAAAAAGAAAFFAFNPSNETLHFQVTAAAPTATAPSLTSDELGGPVRVKWPAGRPLRVLFVGDSITQGRLATSTSRDYVSLVSAALERHGPIDVTDDWHSGAPVEYWMGADFPDVDLTIVELGANLHAQKVAAFRTDYGRLMADIVAAAPHTQMACFSLWRPNIRPDEFTGYDDAIRNQCRGAYVDVRAIMSSARNIGADGFHPNDAGHAAIARAILTMLRLH